MILINTHGDGADRDNSTCSDRGKSPDLLVAHVISFPFFYLISIVYLNINHTEWKVIPILCDTDCAGSRNRRADGFPVQGMSPNYV